MGPSIWEYLWLRAHVSSEDDVEPAIGAHGDPVSTRRIAADLSRSREAVLENLERLEAGMRAQEARANPSGTPKPAAQVPWKISITVDGYLLPDRDGYVNRNVSADHGWLHLEARYNYENLRTGSVWFGYNFSAGMGKVVQSPKTLE